MRNRTGIWVEGEHELGEGARWTDGRLVYVDILAGRLLETRGPDAGPGLHPARELLRLDVPLGAVAPVAGRPGHWIAAAGTGIALLAPDGSADWLARPEDGAAVPTRMNDGVCDRHGRFWAGSLAYDCTPGAGSLYRTDTDGSVHRVLDGLTVVNGPAFTEDGSTLYVAESAAGVILRCALDRAGNIVGTEEFARLPEGHSPDGMTVDTEGHLWVAVWGGAAVHRYAPDASLVTVIGLPVPQPTSVCLLPAGGLLLITTAWSGLSPTGDHGPSGAVLSVPVDAAAPPAAAYAPRAAAPLTGPGQRRQHPQHARQFTADDRAQDT
ncbi:SMP-30/gluconolactonase/LRE family protein (plasmid) [Streptomyces sp. NBC_00841]|uniref:SMP-30/gluconolactonase/LRE family protein n=1 Tax=unclassified Streptomyces TaxID=2593676 RepID=UPI002250ED39|nr:MULTISPECIES: SMP-30/gluconolactonase/LRE family protein [unclassified Streptomyces]MCX4538834.1 SMP-30/gluconolactonase/LRE family protein [Streptomyces sp. NBC_01669]WSA05371.1 SMP-30/gluconolactonase/LRE family protein [Streptomyces sp. NBC_00841]